MTFRVCLWRAARVKLFLFLVTAILAIWWFGSVQLPFGLSWGMDMNTLPGPSTRFWL